MELDRTDAGILAAMQENARLTLAELGRRVNLSASAATDRLRKLEEAGVITAYTATVDPQQIGYPIMAFLRLRYPSSNYRPLHEVLAATPEIIEAHHVTGDDCFIMKAVASSMAHLEQVSGRIGALGSVTTSVVYSSPLPPRALRPLDRH
ncbi:Lrp/AsnC family transcriptional regulator [Hoyosella sp. G463]|uniref:Lrp/AsnC family transcriptional regulator n=1 Tax=Lolliginicoccus lacisalsi TaxID=2742202 RepID=A0A927PLU2_9ACTN|nr:Lrp/AsnC family transcriptional regulator [Lolliginicoccus lacisalsi]MBD8505731.1 Lrp/AsnC family transcriptional regulator [Lolliginicoccus lacisalsi]